MFNINRFVFFTCSNSYSFLEVLWRFEYGLGWFAGCRFLLVHITPNRTSHIVSKLTVSFWTAHPILFFIFALGLFLFWHLFCIVCVCALSAVSASSWGADEAVNASLWSRQKWLWCVVTLSVSLCLCLAPIHLPFYPPPSHLCPLIYSCVFLSLFDVCVTFFPPCTLYLLITFLLFFHLSSSVCLICSHPLFLKFKCASLAGGELAFSIQMTYCANMQAQEH